MQEIFDKKIIINLDAQLSTNIPQTDNPPPLPLDEKSSLSSASVPAPKKKVEKVSRTRLRKPKKPDISGIRHSEKKDRFSDKSFSELNSKKFNENQMSTLTNFHSENKIPFAKEKLHSHSHYPRQVISYGDVNEEIHNQTSKTCFQHSLIGQWSEGLKLSLQNISEAANLTPTIDEECESENENENEISITHPEKEHFLGED